MVLDNEVELSDLQNPTVLEVLLDCSMLQEPNEISDAYRTIREGLVENGHLTAEPCSRYFGSEWVKSTMYKLTEKGYKYMND